MLVALGLGISGVNASLNIGGRPSPSLLPCYPPLPLHLTPSPPSPPLPLEVGPLNPARGLGERCQLPSGVWGGAKSNLVHCILALKSGIWRQKF